MNEEESVSVLHQIDGTKINMIATFKFRKDALIAANALRIRCPKLQFLVIPCDIHQEMQSKSQD